MNKVLLTISLLLPALLLYPDPIIMEAEYGIDIKPNFEITRNSEASGGYALHYGEGAGGIFGIHAHSDQEIELGTALYPFELEKDGQYYVGARVFWMDKCGNQIRASLDNGEMFRINSRDREKHTFQKWYWQISGPFQLSKGRHDLKLIADEDGPWIDQVCIYADGDAAPEGIQEMNWPALFQKESSKPVSISFSKSSQVITSEDGSFSATVWIRKTVPERAFAVLSVELPEDIILKNDPGDCALGFLKQDILKPVQLDFTLAPDSPRGEKTVCVEVKNKDGKTTTAGKTIFLKPFDWYILGPFPAWMHAEHPLDFGKNVNLNKKVAIGNIPPASWTGMSTGAFNPFQTIDFEYLYGQSVSKTAYLYTEIEAPQTKKYLFLINNDGATDIWVDGNLIYQEHWHHPAMGWLRQQSVNLEKGRHVILIRSEQNDKPDNDFQKNYWLFRLRIRDSRKKTSDIRGLECQKNR